MKARIVVGLLVSALLAAPALAQRTPEPIVNYPDQAIAKPLAAEQVKQAIAAAIGNTRPWTVAYEPNGTILASRAWGDHVIVVAITYTANRYSMTYRDSTNMKYSAVPIVDSRQIANQRNVAQRTGPVIHPFYNRYVMELKDAINAELRKL